ncbi:MULTISPECIES: N-6 DNA methylase [unclassified Marinobacter]|jgi:type I restriction enzyme M protein|uniref:class I SAM-dependent DNA methyltransferase n=1 Tax=unclassified Marinobacter TaxID=83889 RepID=UPI00200BD714|nr:MULTISPECIES: N-6 DNA methylase [unclassified Marinobacter]MCL1476647.1 type I restriction-modification system subunit M [Marinobacter sp.]MCL1481165.1 type I restriction-modification system subunit M [Marinobacter sp.]MCL1485437.1 type I restriction-modification system subunit M [Marinobacter sp.]MCL1487969.1 type I restriction-modification system subunit M [Marinobacter sp.]UQG56123.1 type I restriction-modification system subunit M [Marinobacter sp. M4C]
MTNNSIVQKLWNLCDVLKDDGINYSDYVTELVLLLFLKMVHESTEAGTLKKHPLPERCRWSDLNGKSGINLLNDYKRILLSLSTGRDGDGTLVHDDALISAIYADAQTRLREPRHLEQMIKTLDQIDWFSAQKDGLGDLYEGLLEKNANETKSGAGQYFTPRALINSMVRCLKPRHGEIIQDPAAGTAGFLTTAHEYIKNQTDDLYDLTDQQKVFQTTRAYVGIELVPGTRRLALMNCLLHGLEGSEEGVVHLGNALGLTGSGLAKADVILANPPFGTSKGGDASITRDDLTYKTSNKQLVFLQHIYRNLKPGGRAAVVLPDNVLFEAGVGADVRRDLMHKCNLHTILRLPTGIFYAQGVKTNVLFFTKGSATDKYQEQNCTQNVWVYDLRTNMPSFGKRTPFGEQHLKPFEAVYGEDPNGQSPRTEGEWSFHADNIELPAETKATEENHGVNERMLHSRWRCFSRQWITDSKGDSLDISWLKDSDSVYAANLPEPSVLAGEAMSELVLALGELDGLMRELGAGDEADGARVLLHEVLGEVK